MQEKYLAIVGAVFIACAFALIISIAYFGAMREISEKNYLSSLTPSEREHIVAYAEEQQAEQESINAENAQRLSDFLNTPISLQWAIFVFIGIQLLIWGAKLFSRW